MFKNAPFQKVSGQILQAMLLTFFFILPPVSSGLNNFLIAKQYKSDRCHMQHRKQQNCALSNIKTFCIPLFCQKAEKQVLANFYFVNYIFMTSFPSGLRL